MMKICLIGCGRVAKSHMEGALQIKDRLQVVAAVDPNIDNAKMFCDEYGIDKAFSSFEEACANVEFDAVDMCLPNHLHCEFTVKAAEAKKHILIEKPMANTIKECEIMIEAADKNGVNLMIGQSRRYFDSVFKSKEMIDSKEIGELITISANLYAYLEKAPTPWWNKIETAGGLMIPIWGSHIIDYCMWAFDEMPQRVYCESYSINPTWEGEDEVMMTLGFSNNRFAAIRMSWNTKLKDEAWNGEGKMLSSADAVYERYIQGTEKSLYLNDETELKCNGRIIEKDDGTLTNFARQYIEFIDSVEENREPLTSGRKIINVIKVQNAALESAKTHQVVML